MKIFTAEQIRAGDSYTIKNEPIDSIELMERAATSCTSWIQKNFYKDTSFYIFCGIGNNGGDGFALARLLQDKIYPVKAIKVLFSNKVSKDCQKNIETLENNHPNSLQTIQNIAEFPSIPKEAIIIDAIFGTGLNRPLKGFVAEVVQKINDCKNTIIAIDIPSGLQAENNPNNKIAVRATHSLSFEFNKLAFFFKENEQLLGHIHILPIGIHQKYIQETTTSYHLTDEEYIHKHLKKRTPFTHKGTYGHALIIAGSFGKIGAAVLATKATIQSGAGLTTVYIPKCGYQILQISVPEAMVLCDLKENYFSQLPHENLKLNSIGIGPGIGTEKITEHFLKKILKEYTIPMVVDADALNILSKHPKWYEYLPQNTILTPHPKEFERLFGKTTNTYERLQLQIQKSKDLKVTILLKGHHTTISSPTGMVWFNNTGNSGMATGGSGDVLTGLLTGLLAQGYTAPIAAVLGAWLHGKAGDLALQKESKESLTATSIIAHLGKAFKESSYR